jgi:hypothetical protein
VNPAVVEMELFLLILVVALSFVAMFVGAVIGALYCLCCGVRWLVVLGRGQIAGRHGLPEHGDSRPATPAVRARASAALADGYVTGRLDLSEFEERTAAALVSQTRSEVAWACRGLPQRRGRISPDGAPLAAVGGALALLGPTMMVRLVGAGLVGAGLLATRGTRLAAVAFAAGLLVLVSLPATVAVGAGGLWRARSLRNASS